MIRSACFLISFGAAFSAMAAIADGIVLTDQYWLPCRAATAQAWAKAETFCALRGQTVQNYKYSECWDDIFVDRQVSQYPGMTETRTATFPTTNVSLAFGCTGGVN